MSRLVKMLSPKYISLAAVFIPILTSAYVFTHAE